MSLTTGWAYGLVGTRNPISGVWVLPSPAANDGLHLVALDNEVSDALALYRPMLVICAEPLVHKRQTSHRLLIELAAMVHSACSRMNVDYREQPEQTMRKAVIGRGTFPKGTTKQVVMAWCRAKGWDVESDDEGDARVVWQYAVDLTRRRRRPFVRESEGVGA